MTLHLKPDRADVTVALSGLGVVSPVRIVVAGDWHGNRDAATQSLLLAANNAASVVIQTGDFGIWPGEHGSRYLNHVATRAEQLGVHVLWLDGNHEDFDQLEAINPGPEGLRALSSHLIHLPRGARWTWSDIRFCAVGGATSLDRPVRLEGVSWWPQEELLEFQCADIIAAGTCDVLFTHDVTQEVNVLGIQHRVYNSDWARYELERAWIHRERVGTLTAALKPTHLFHGHFHQAYQKLAETTFGVVNVTGLGADHDGDSNRLVVEFDQLKDEIETLRRART
jgi:Icc-related predicted phosphoesterase